MDDIKQYKKQYRENHKEEIKQYKKQYYLANAEYCKEYNKQYREANAKYYKKYNKEHNKKWREANPEHCKEYHKQWLKTNTEHRKKWYNEYEKNKYKTDLKFNLNSRMSRAIRSSLKNSKDGRSWESLVNYTLKDLIKYLQKTIPEGYSWRDFLEGKLQIDHKIPISVFNFTKPEHIDFQRCWTLKNLQLLPAEENLKKSDKLLEPLQLTFLI